MRRHACCFTGNPERRSLCEAMVLSPAHRGSHSTRRATVDHIARIGLQRALEWSTDESQNRRDTADTPESCPENHRDGRSLSKERRANDKARSQFIVRRGRWLDQETRRCKPHVDRAEALILDFLRTSGASLGGSKSLVDQTGESQAVLGLMTHLNQVGQTGSTPRHPKGLSTCCHGEEPHVVGWRSINERRGVNPDPNCGSARGKAEVLYVADAFEVLAKLNALISEINQDKSEVAVQLA